VAAHLKALADDGAFSSAPAQSLEALLGPFLQTHSSGSPNAVAVRFAPSLTKIKASPKQITKLFELLTASLTAAADKDTPLTVEAGSGADAEGAPLVKIQFRDEGPDWTPEQRARLFAPFTRQATDRFGLDLVTGFFIVHHHGGRISLPGQSKLRVVIELPVDPLAAGPDELDGNQLSDLFRQDLGFA